jgi:hypothetical protein
MKLTKEEKSVLTDLIKETDEQLSNLKRIFKHRYEGVKSKNNTLYAENIIKQENRLNVLKKLY